MAWWTGAQLTPDREPGGAERDGQKRQQDDQIDHGGGFLGEWVIRYADYRSQLTRQQLASENSGRAIASRSRVGARGDFLS